MTRVSSDGAGSPVRAGDRRRRQAARVATASSPNREGSGTMVRTPLPANCEVSHCQPGWKPSVGRSSRPGVRPRMPGPETADQSSRSKRSCRAGCPPLAHSRRRRPGPSAVKSSTPSPAEAKTSRSDPPAEASCSSRLASAVKTASPSSGARVRVPAPPFSSGRPGAMWPARVRPAVPVGATRPLPPRTAPVARAKGPEPVAEPLLLPTSRIPPCT